MSSHRDDKRRSGQPIAEGDQPGATGWIAAIDIGGTKIAGGLVDRDGRVDHAVARPTPGSENPEVVMNAVYEVLDSLAAEDDWAGVQAVGIGSAGPVDVERGEVSPVNIPAWQGFPLLEHLSRHRATEDKPLTLAGDAVAMAAGELCHGAAAGYRNVLCMVVSTGVGGGLILGGRIMPGSTGNAGHIGHISVDFGGDPCPCGSTGCLEQYAAGPAIARHALACGWTPRDADHSAAAVARAAALGDQAALAAFDRAGRALAAGIAATAALVETDTVVIGGGVAQAGDLLFEPLRRWLPRYATLAFTRDIKVLPAKLGTRAGLVGAAAYARTMRHALEPA